MKYFIFVLIIAAVAAVTVLIGKSIKANHGRSASSQMLWYGREREYYIYEMLSSCFPRKNIFRNLSFPVKKGEEKLWTEVDIVCVTHGGVVVIEVKGAKGRIDNPESGEWTQMYKDKVLKFQNPHEQNHGHVIAVENALKREGIIQLPVYNVVVFTEQDVKFRNHYKWLMRPEQIVDFVAHLDDRFAMSGKDIKNVDAVLEKYRKPHKPTAAKRRAGQNARVR
ncbi:MAG: NERD domain-containing protein [Clostridia bacterium]|nr:NERD domain-containing protein [Clostridia bacterium]